MKRFYFISIAGFYVLITVIAYARPYFQEFLAEHQKQIEEGLERAMAIDGPAPALPVAVSRKKPKISIRANLGRAMVHHGYDPKRLAHGGVPIVPAKAAVGGPLSNGDKKDNSLENNSASS